MELAGFCGLAYSSVTKWVFYLFMLVLVVGAIHSHGKTESESSKYNKTQQIFFTWPCSGECHSVIWPELLVVGRSSPIISLCMAYGHRRIDGNRLTAQSCSNTVTEEEEIHPNITLVLYVCIQQIIHVIVIITHYYIYNISGGAKKKFFGSH